MKKLYFIIIALAAILLHSCYKEDKNLFDESSANRLTAAALNDRKLLESSTNGWLLEYYPGGTEKTLGGYNMLIKFHDGKVDLATDVETEGDDGETVPAWQTTASLYDVIMDEGPVITFNSYNPVIHYFTQPIASWLGADPVGNAGDFEFIITKTTDEEVTLRGRKYGTVMRMTRLADDFDAKAFSEKVDKVINGQKFSFYEIYADGQDIGYLELSSGTRRMVSTIKGQDSQAYSFVYTADGISFSDSLKFDGIAEAKFTFDEAKQEFVGNKITLKGIDDPVYTQFIGDYVLKTDADPVGQDVSIVADIKNVSYILKGLSYNGTPFDVEVSYYHGAAEIDSQTTSATYGGQPISFFAAKASSGQYGTSSFLGLIATQTGENPVTYTFSDNGWGALTGVQLDSFFAGPYSAAQKSFTGDILELAHPILIKK